MNEQIIDVAKTLHACQQALLSADDQDVASAESVLSYLALHLKHRKAPQGTVSTEVETPPRPRTSVRGVTPGPFGGRLTGQHMDEVDVAQANIDAYTRNPKKKPEGPRAVGYCLNCGPDEPLPQPMRWCDGDCFSDWSKRNRK